MLEKIKRRLKIEDNLSDVLIEEYIEEATQRILSYCNINELPNELEFVVIQIVIDLLKENEKQIESITRGDTTIKYVNENYNKLTGAGGAEFLKNYIGILNKFRRVRLL